jgi:hypothetical protein
MALVPCAECGRQISDKAAACPHCGNPLSPAPAAPAPVSVATAPGQAVTTEATGKGWKVVQLVGALIMTAGAVACTASKTPGTGTQLFILGMIVFLAGRAGAWWSHG